MKKLRSQFRAYILVPMILVILGSGILLYFISSRIVLQQLLNLGVSGLQQAVDEIDATFGTGVHTLRILAVHEGLASHSEGNIRALFKELRTRLPIEGIFLTMLNGKTVWSTEGEIPKNFEPMFEPWFIDALDSPDPVITGPTVSPFSSEKILFVSSRIADANDFITGVIAYSVPIRRIELNIESSPLFADKESFNFFTFLRDGTFLLDSNYKLIGTKLGSLDDDLHIRMRQALSENRPFWHGVGLVNNEKYFGGYNKSRYGELYVGLLVPLSEGMKPVIALETWYLTVGAVCVILLVITLTIFARRIAKPINMLTAAAGRFTKGEAHQPLPIVSNDELGELTAAFNEMGLGIEQRDFIRNTFGRYLDPEIVKEVLESKNGLEIGGEKRDMSMLMSDLRGFTAQTVGMPPELVLKLLNRYLGAMVDVLVSHKAVIDEMQGDGILAFFGAPEPATDHALKAVACAIDMQLAMEHVNRDNASEGLPHLEMGIGVNTGRVVVGNIGSETRTKYGIVGSAVNFTGRVESYTLGGQILISQECYDRLQDVLEVRNVISVEMKGFQGPVNLYDVRGLRGSINKFLSDDFEEPMPLKRPMPVTMRLIKKKVVSEEAYAGSITHLSETSALLQSSSRIEDGVEMRIDYVEKDLEFTSETFGRVLKVQHAGELYIWSIRFTFLTPEARKYLRNFAGKN